MQVGTPVKITGGTHKGKKGTIVSNRATNGRQRGKVPVVVGARNDLYWVNPDWICEIFPAPENTEPNTSEIQDKILEFLRSRLLNTAISDIQIAMAIDLSLFAMRKLLQTLVNDGFVDSVLDNQYLLNKCDQLELSDFLKESEDFADLPNSLVDLNGSNPLNLITTQCKSCELIITITSTTETSVAITPPQAQPTSTQLAFPAQGQAKPEHAPDLTTQNQIFGLKLCDAFVKEDPRLSLLKTLRDLSIEDFEQSLADSEWQAMNGMFRSFYQQRKSDLAKAVPEFLSSPTLVASSGKNSRPSGQTKCEKWFKKNGITAGSQCLSVEMMAAISGFPTTWTDCLLELSQKANPIDSAAATCTVEPSFPNRQQSHSTELDTFTPLLPGKQWIDPNLIILKDGTQSRDVDAVYETDVRTVQQYAEVMAENLWEWERDPLPVAFLSESGKIYAGDCHHRVSAAVVAKKQIYVDLRVGELIDAVLYSCSANTNHGLPLRPKDQRKRIELFLDVLSKLDEVRSRSLHSSISDLSEIERRNGNWSARVIAKYLKLTESGYRTVINIMSEKKMTEKFSHFKIGEWVHAACWGENVIAQIHSFDKRKGIFVIPQKGTLDFSGQIMAATYIHPGNLKKVNAPIDANFIDPADCTEQQSSINSVEEELKQKSLSLGIPISGLPDLNRNEGDPQTLQDCLLVGVSLDKTIANAVIARIEEILEQISDEQIEKIWLAIAPRVCSLGLGVECAKT